MALPNFKKYIASQKNLLYSENIHSDYKKYDPGKRTTKTAVTTTTTTHHSISLHKTPHEDVSKQNSASPYTSSLRRSPSEWFLAENQYQPLSTSIIPRSNIARHSTEDDTIGVKNLKTHVFGGIHALKTRSTLAATIDGGGGGGGGEPPDDEPPENLFDMPIEPIMVGTPLRDALLKGLTGSNDTKTTEGTKRPYNLSLK